MESINREFWGKKTFCMITGASQGIGRTLAVAFSRLFAEGSTVVLLARTERGLEETKFLISEANSKVNVKVRLILYKAVKITCYYLVK